MAMMAGCPLAVFANLTITVVRNRESGIYKRRRGAPLPASAIIAARALIAVLTAVTITVILVAIGWAAYGAPLPSHTTAVFALDVAVGAAAFCCLGFALATFIHNVDAAQPIGLAIVLPLTFICGIFIPFSALPHRLADIGSIFPVHALTDALLAIYNPHTAGAGLLLGRPGHPRRPGRSGPDHRRAPLQVAAPRRLNTRNRNPGRLPGTATGSLGATTAGARSLHRDMPSGPRCLTSANPAARHNCVLCVRGTEQVAHHGAAPSRQGT
jgi:ABC-2 type transporter